jgi:hypothetical protein
MQCNMCAREGRAQEAVALCRYCQAGLCAEPLAADHAYAYPAPRYRCMHPLPQPPSTMKTAAPAGVG